MTHDLNQIVARYGGMVTGVCRRALGNAQEAEDAAQTVFLIFLKKAPSLDPGTVLATWLYRTAVYVSCNLVRARIRREQVPPTPTPPAPRDELVSEEARAHLDDAIARLPEPVQDAIVVHYLHGKTLGETAATLGCPVKTLEKRVGRGLELLRGLLKGSGVAITSAALVALLQSEGTAQTPIRPSLLRKLLLPTSAALVLVAFVTGHLRSTAADREAAARPIARDAAAGPSSVEATKDATALRKSEASALPFPATFEDLARGFRKLRELPEVHEHWTALGIDLRLDELRNIVVLDLPDADHRPNENTGFLIRQGFDCWATRNPRAAVEWLYRACAILPSSQGWRLFRADESVTILESALDQWSRQDPLALEEWIERLPENPAGESVLLEYSIQTARRGTRPFGEIATRLQTLPYSWAKVMAVSTLVENWGRQDPRAAADWLAALPLQLGPGIGSSGDEDDLSPLARRPTYPEDPAIHLDHSRYYAVKDLAKAWAGADPLAALRWAEGLSRAEDRDRALIGVGEAWAETDPTAALQYVAGRPDTMWRNEWIQNVVVRLSKENPDAARNAVLFLPTELQGSMMSFVLHEWGKERPREGTMEIVRAMVEAGPAQAPLYNWAVSNLIEAWTRQEPSAAIAWTRAIEDPALRDLLWAKVGAALAPLEPLAALDWARQIPEGEAREEILGAVVGWTASRDRDLAQRIVAQMAPGVHRESGFSMIGFHWAQESPEAAMAWAGSLPDSTDRRNSIVGAVVGWAEVDAEAATAAAQDLEGDMKLDALKFVDLKRIRSRRAALRTGLLQVP